MRDRAAPEMEERSVASANLVEVPRDSLSREALRGVIEEFVTRPGTDYGTEEKTIEAKIADVERQLERGDVVIVFDLEAETTNIIPSCRTSL